MSRWHCVRICLEMVLLTGAASGMAQRTSDRESLSGDIKAVDVRDLPRVTAYLGVYDNRNEFIPGLSSDNIDILLQPHNSNERPIRPSFELTSFSTAGRVLVVALLVDHSGSMTPAIPECRKAVKKFASQLAPQDYALLTTFGTRRRQLTPSPVRRAELAAAADHIDASNEDTAINAALREALSQISAVKGDRRAIVLLSDGGQNAGGYSLTEVIRCAQLARVSVHTVGLGRLVNRQYLVRLAKETDGTCRFAYGPREVATLYSAIAGSLHDEYILHMQNVNMKVGHWYTMCVTVRYGGLTVRTERRILADPSPPRNGVAVRPTTDPGDFVPLATVLIVVLTGSVCVWVMSKARRDRIE